MSTGEGCERTVIGSGKTGNVVSAQAGRRSPEESMLVMDSRLRLLLALSPSPDSILGGDSRKVLMESKLCTLTEIRELDSSDAQQEKERVRKSDGANTSNVFLSRW